MRPEEERYILENAGKKSVKAIAREIGLKERKVRRFLDSRASRTERQRDQTPVTGSDAAHAPVKTPRWANIVIILLIAAIGFAAYANSLTNQFIWDDKFLVIENKAIESFSNIPHVFTHELFQLVDGPTGYYRPIQAVSYMVDYLFWKRDPFGYHIMSILLQVLNAILVFFLSLLVLKDRLKSFIIAAIFCVHPAFVPIVSYISGRADLLGLLFSLISIYIVIDYLSREKKTVAIWFAPCFYALAILSKEYYIICPVFIILFMLAIRGSLKISRQLKLILISLLAVAVFYAIIRMTALNFHQKIGGMAMVPFAARAAVFPYILAIYVSTLLFPFNLGLEKKLVYSSLVEPRFILSYIVPVLIIVAFYYFVKTNRRKELFFLGWFTAAILPVTNLFIPLKVFCADHWTYMAAIGFFGVIVSVADGALSYIKVPGKIRFVFGVAAIVFFAALTINENRYWRNEEVFFSRTSERSPHHSRAQFNMATIYEDKGDLKKALELYSNAVKESRGKGSYIFDRRGMLYRKLGDMKKAREDCEEAVRLEPTVAVYHNNLGGIYAELGMTEKAREEFNEALRLDPDNELARKNLDALSPNGEGSDEEE